jgi:hypothetical protein
MSARSTHYLAHRYQLEALIADLVGPDAGAESWQIALKLVTTLLQECHGCGAPLGVWPRHDLLCATCRRRRPWERN